MSKLKSSKANPTRSTALARPDDSIWVPVRGLWQPNENEERFVVCVGRMALDTLAANGVVDRATFIQNLRGLADCLEKQPNDQAHA